MRFTIGLPITKIEYLKNTLKSIEELSYRDFEIIIRNNADNLELKKEIKKLCAPILENNNAKYYENNEHLNISENFNKILKEAKGDYFTILSDDDVLHKDYLQEFSTLIDKYPDLNVFHCRVKMIDSQDELLDFTEVCPEYESLADFVYHRLTGKRTLFLSDFVVSTLALKNIGGFIVLPYGWGLDDITWCRLSGRGIAFTSEILLSYRVNQNNFSNNKKTLLLRLRDLEVCKSEYQKIILSENFKEHSIYPIDFLLSKNESRIANMKTSVIYLYAKSGSIAQFIKFFFENVNIHSLSYKIFIKALLKNILGIK